MLITAKEQLQEFSASKCLWIGIPGIEVTKKGTTFLTYYSGGTREEIGNFVVLVRSEDNVHFSEPVAVCYQEGYRCFDPCLWIDPSDRLWLIWARCPEDGVYAAICEEPDKEKLEFGNEFFIGHNVMMNKPTVLSTGDWAFPLAVWNYGIRSLPAEYDSDIEPKGSYMYLTSDGGKTFRKMGYAEVSKRSFDEHMFLEMTNGMIRCFVRTTYGIGAADTCDEGRHWSRDFDTGYGGPSSRFHIRRLASGRVLLINHYEFNGRNNLTALLSEDDGKTFPYRLLLDERKHVSYPDACEDQEGRIYITYDRERGAFKQCMKEVMESAREVLIACVTEDDIMNGTIVTEGSFLKRIACKLTDYNGKMKNPFCEKEYFTTDEYVAYLEQTSPVPEDILSELFDAYGIDCAHLHNVEVRRLDDLVERYNIRKESKILKEMIDIVKKGDNSFGWKNESGLVDEICRYVSNHQDEDLETESIAKRFCLSVSYLRYLFKKHTGTTLGNYKTFQKIKTAKILLRMTDDKISEIAAMCGFDSPSYFAEIFLKEVGVTPKKYRETKRNGGDKNEQR